MWKPYLESICQTYAKWWEVYTLTDVAGKKPLEQQQNISPLLDLGLMVQTLAEEKQKERPDEKNERLTVLEGLRKYAPNHVLLVGRPGSGKSTALARFLLEEADKVRYFLEKEESPLSPPFERRETRQTPPFLGKTEEESPLSPPFERGETRQTPPLQRAVGGDKNLQRRAGGDKPKIPILIELRYSQTSVLERIQKFLYKHHPNINIDTPTLETWLRQGEFLLLFDGFNEMASEAARQQVRMFRQDYPQTAMVFTTRDLSLGGDLGIEKKLEMQPLTESQMQEFVCAYLPEHGKKLWQQLHGRLRELGETPMFLLMLCSVFGYQTVMPANLGLVFRSFTQSYRSRLKQDVPVDESSRRWWDRLLQELAWVMTNGKSKTEIMVAISRQKAEAVLTEFLRGEVVSPTDCAMRWLEDLLEHHLIQVGDDGQISFRYQLLQEYYVAERLLSRLSDLSDYELQWDYLNYLKWTEVVALMLGLVEDEGLAVRVVKLALEVDWFLGARLVGEVQQRFQEQAFAQVEQLELSVLMKVYLAYLTKSGGAVPDLIPLLEDSGEYVRQCAVFVLGEIATVPEKSETVIPVLIPLLEDSNSDVRKIAVKTVGKICSETEIPALIPLLEDSNSDVRANAAEALGEIASETEIPVLIPLLEDSNSDVRKIAVKTVGKIGTVPEKSETVISRLIPLLKDSISDVRANAVEALGKIGTVTEKSETVILRLIPLLEDSNSDVRRNAVETVGKIASETAIERLIPLLGDSDFLVRWGAVEALGKIGTVPEKSETVISRLIPLLGDSDSDVPIAVGEVLINIGTVPEKSETVILRLIPLLEHSDQSVRINAVATLIKIGTVPEKSGTVISRLIMLLEHSDKSVRINAAATLMNIGSETVVTRLIPLLKDSDSDVRKIAVFALGKVDSETVISRLISLLEHSDYDVRAIAGAVLGKVGCETAIPGLIPLLKHSDSDVRSIAGAILMNIGSETAIEGLIPLLKHSDSHVRINAAAILMNIGSETAIEGLIPLLKHSDSDVRSIAGAILMKIGSETVISRLIPLLEHSDFDMCIIIRTLIQIGSKTAIEGLIPFLEDLDSDVRIIIITAAVTLTQTQIGSENPIVGLISLLEHSDKFVRINAVATLIQIQIGWKTGIPELISLLKHSDKFVRRSAAKALELMDKIVSEAAILGLVSVLKHSDKYVRRSAAKALINIVSKIPIERLIPLLKDSNKCVRRIATKTLSNIDSETAIPKLILLLEYSDKYVRRSAAKALINIVSETPVLNLIVLLKHSDKYVRRSVTEVVINIGSETAILGLIPLIKHSDSNVCWRAAEALGEIGSEAAISGLILLLKHLDSNVRIKAVEALINIGSEKAISGLMEVLEDSDSNVREKAAEALGQIGSENTMFELTKKFIELTKKTQKDRLFAEILFGTIDTIQTIQKRFKYYKPTPKIPMSNKLSHNYALLIGVGDCKYPNWSLPVTVKDVQAIKSFLINLDLCGYIDDENHLHLLSNEKATKQNILDNLNWLQQQAKNDPEATILVYYSGHGWLDKSTQNYYLIPHDTSPIKLQKTALPVTDFNNALQQISSQKLLVIIDSCHAQGMATAKETEELELPDDFSQTALPKNLRHELRKGTGRAVFTSSTGEELSWIRSDETMSIYTYHFLEALQGGGNKPGDKFVKLSNLMSYVYETVIESAQQIGKKQTPIFDFSQTEDFPVALLCGGKGLPDGGWEEVRQEVQAKIQAGGDVYQAGGDNIREIDISGNSGTITIGDIGSKRNSK